MTVIEHVDVFKKSGFIFKVDPDAPPTKKLKLVTVPFSKNTTFNEQGIHTSYKLIHQIFMK